MATEALRGEDEMNDDALVGARESGLFKETLAIELAEPSQAPILVRPDAGEGEQGWTTRVQEALALSPGARVGVAAEDAGLAAAVAVRLAVSVADAGRRVVIVDGSVRAPAIAKALDGDGDEGLVDSVLFGVSTAVTARRTLAAGVSLMTSGSAPVSAEEVFRSDNFEATLLGFAQDVIVFVALPAGFLSAAAHALSHVVVLGRSSAELVSGGRLVADAPGQRPSHVVGLLVDRPHVRRPPGLAESLEAAETPASQEPETAEPVTEPAVPREDRSTAPPSEPSPGPPLEHERRSRVRTAYRTPAPVDTKQRRSARPLVLGLVAIGVVALVAAWQFGAFDSLVGTQNPPRAGIGAEPPAAGGARGATGAPDTAAPVAADTASVPADAPEAPAAVEPAGETPTPARLAGPGGRYVIYVSSHRVETAALSDAAALEELNVASAVVRAEVGETGTWYRVRVAGAYPTLEAARSALEIVKSLAYSGAWIERIPIPESR
jgi:septal ring-binding cell division protein DamX